MKTLVIAIGRPGQGIGEELKSLNSEMFEIISIDYRGIPNLLIPKCTSYEKYEQTMDGYIDALDNWIKMKKDFSRVLCVMGSSKISGISLRVLSRFKDVPIDVLYIRSESFEFYTADQMRAESHMFAALQAFAAHGLINELVLVDNQRVEKAIDKAAAKDYYGTLNQMIGYTLYYKMFYENSEPELGQSGPVSPVANIVTIGVSDPKTGEDFSFFDLQMPREKWYYYGIGSKSTVNRFELMGSIREQMRNKKTDGRIDVKFGVFSFEEEDGLLSCFFQLRSSLVQEHERLYGGIPNGNE